jgi:hypothetical protein
MTGKGSCPESEFQCQLFEVRSNRGGDKVKTSDWKFKYD